MDNVHLEPQPGGAMPVYLIGDTIIVHRNNLRRRYVVALGTGMWVLGFMSGIVVGTRMMARADDTPPAHTPDSRQWELRVPLPMPAPDPRQGELEQWVPRTPGQ